MKRSIVLISLLTAATTPVLAEQASQSPQVTLAFKPESADVSACVSMFVARIFPGQGLTLPVESADSRQNVGVQKLYVRQTDQEITMYARAKKDKSRLAIGSCSVSRNGRVMSVSVRTNSALKLARLQPNDVELAMANP